MVFALRAGREFRSYLWTNSLPNTIIATRRPTSGSPNLFLSFPLVLLVGKESRFGERSDVLECQFSFLSFALQQQPRKHTTTPFFPSYAWRSCSVSWCWSAKQMIEKKHSNTSMVFIILGLQQTFLKSLLYWM